MQFTNISTKLVSFSASPIRHLDHPIAEYNSEASTSQSSSPSTLSLNNGAVVAEAQPCELLSSRHDPVAAGDGDLANDFTSFASSPLIQSPTSEQPQAPSVWEKIIVYKYDIVLLSLLIQLLHGLSLVSLEGTYVFLPFAVYAVTKTIFFPVQTNSKLANMLLLLNQFSRQANGLQKILHVTQWTGTIFQDVSVYLFTTICIQSLYITLKESFVT